METKDKVFFIGGVTTYFIVVIGFLLFLTWNGRVNQKRRAASKDASDIFATIDSAKAEIKEVDSLLVLYRKEIKLRDSLIQLLIQKQQ